MDRTIGILVSAHNLSGSVDSKGNGPASTGDVNGAETAMTQQKAMLRVAGINVPSHDLSNRVNLKRIGKNSTGDINRGKGRLCREDRGSCQQQVKRDQIQYSQPPHFFCRCFPVLFGFGPGWDAYSG